VAKALTRRGARIVVISEPGGLPGVTPTAVLLGIPGISEVAMDADSSPARSLSAYVKGFPAID
jgi:hypothetical protein